MPPIKMGCKPSRQTERLLAELAALKAEVERLPPLEAEVATLRRFKAAYDGDGATIAHLLQAPEYATCFNGPLHKEGWGL